MTAQVKALNALAADEPEVWDGVDILVVLDGSTDGSLESLRAEQGVLPLRTISQDNRGLAKARNRCIAEAEGEIIWFLDDDLLPLHGALATHRLAHEGTRKGGLLGPCLLPENLEISVDGRAWWERRFRELSTLDSIPVNLFSTANLSIEASAVRSIGGFDETFVGYGYEDNELGCRLASAGVVTRFAQTAAVWHNSTIDDRQTFRRQRDLGRNLVRLLTIHPELSELFLPSGDAFSGHPTLRRLPASALWGFGTVAYRLASIAGPKRERVYQRLRSVAWTAAFAAGAND